MVEHWISWPLTQWAHKKKKPIKTQRYFDSFSLIHCSFSCSYQYWIWDTIWIAFLLLFIIIKWICSKCNAILWNCLFFRFTEARWRCAKNFVAILHFMLCLHHSFIHLLWALKLLVWRECGRFFVTISELQ